MFGMCMRYANVNNMRYRVNCIGDIVNFAPSESCIMEMSHAVLCTFTIFMDIVVSNSV